MRRAVIAFTAFLGGLVLLLSSPAWADGEALKGTLQNQGQPVNGVKISVTTQDGKPVAEVTSGADGKWQVPVPKAGEYKVTLDQKTLPSGVALKFKDKDTLTVQVYEGSQRNVLFALGAAGQQGNGPASSDSSFWNRVAQLTFEGFNLGLIIALAAMGLSLIFGTTGLTNFAHGELLTLGAMSAYFFNVVLGIQLIPATVIAVIVGGAFGYLQDRFFWGKLRQRGSSLLAMMIISIGLALFLRYLFLFLFGGESAAYTDYNAQAGIQVGPISAAPKNFIAMGIELAVLLIVGLALLKTRTGKAARAVADNPALAASSGINVDRVIRIIWTAGGAVAALAGVMLGLSQNVGYQMGFQILLLVFAGVTLGGLGTAFGALVGSIVVGLFIQLSTLVVPTELKTVGALLVLILVMLFRPQGILGRRERIG
ncbi:branched-chain amino acid ABC transporter permease [Planotetraspora sp. A-T 1434]|uniref:branched-chain amino acid ABC transporter permease n=1 Tax=Planotetraspora sp. A-T 1434 TaxID=2979219 RepID=UPI0021BE7956|nr:branched-chain amino acid ABC transporter permease [Planotetraspora sp. A-T 1434]MCT9930569.1 branched-chain amino acid ABC transporter permease [Planotetraspora sp. A-T 1434]